MQTHNTKTIILQTQNDNMNKGHFNYRHFGHAVMAAHVESSKFDTEKKFNSCLVVTAHGVAESLIGDNLCLSFQEGLETLLYHL